jgi:hypothetical protein
MYYGQIPLFRNGAAKWREKAQAAFAGAQALQKNGDRDAAWLQIQHALVLEKSFLSANPWKDRGDIAKFSDALQKLTGEIETARAKEFPKLAQKLDLVIRHQTIEAALDTLTKAAGIKAEIVPGSLADAGELMGVAELRVNYLDLRRATVAQALDWLLAPVHLTWRVSGKDAITVGTTRRLPGVSVWTYNVANLLTLTKAELGDKGQAQKPERAMKEFAEAMAEVIGKDAVTLVSPSRLVVYGDKDKHALTESCLQFLSTGTCKGEPAKVLQALIQKSVPRCAAYATNQKQRMEKLAQRRLAAALDRYSWQLLAAKARGESDDEAMAELEAAWASPHLASVPDALVFRSAWATNSLKPGDRWATLKPETNRVAAIYAALALPEATGLKKSLAKDWLAATLFSPTAESDAAFLKVISAHAITDNDLVALAHVAAQRRGGEVWKLWREELPVTTGQQSLNGHVVVFVNQPTDGN